MKKSVLVAFCVFLTIGCGEPPGQNETQPLDFTGNDTSVNTPGGASNSSGATVNGKTNFVLVACPVVCGHSSNPDGYAVYGRNSAATGWGIAVAGISDSDGGYGMYTEGWTGLYATGVNGIDAHGSDVAIRATGALYGIVAMTLPGGLYGIISYGADSGVYATGGIWGFKTPNSSYIGKDIQLGGTINAPNITWGTGIATVDCPEVGECSCPNGYFAASIVNRGASIICRQI